MILDTEYSSFYFAGVPEEQKELAEQIHSNMSPGERGALELYFLPYPTGETEYDQLQQGRSD